MRGSLTISAADYSEPVPFLGHGGMARQRIFKTLPATLIFFAIEAFTDVVDDCERFSEDDVDGNYWYENNIKLLYFSRC